MGQLALTPMQGRHSGVPCAMALKVTTLLTLVDAIVAEASPAYPQGVRAQTPV